MRLPRSRSCQFFQTLLGLHLVGRLDPETNEGNPTHWLVLPLPGLAARKRPAQSATMELKSMNRLARDSQHAVAADDAVGKLPRPAAKGAHIDRRARGEEPGSIVVGMSRLQSLPLVPFVFNREGRRPFRMH